MQIKQFPHFLSTDDGKHKKKIGTLGTFRAAVGLIILNTKNDVLLTQRSSSNEKSPSTWEIVFGRVDQGERFEDAAIREAREELDIEVQLERIVSTMHFMRLPSEPEHIGVIFVARCGENQMITPDPKEIAAWEWLSLSDAIVKVADYTRPHLEWTQKIAHLHS